MDCWLYRATNSYLLFIFLSFFVIDTTIFHSLDVCKKYFLPCLYCWLYGATISFCRLPTLQKYGKFKLSSYLPSLEAFYEQAYYVFVKQQRVTTWEAESRQQCEMDDEVFKFVNSFKMKITTSLESRRVNVFFFSLARTALT